MAADEYEEVISSGGLKIKGMNLGKKKKRKQKSTISESLTSKDKPNDYTKLAKTLIETTTRNANQKQITNNNNNNEVEPIESTSSSSTTTTTTTIINNPDINITRVEKTRAEIKFEQVQKMRLVEKVKKQALKTHKDRVADFNLRLENQSEHFDIPKVGPG